MPEPRSSGHHPVPAAAPNPAPDPAQGPAAASSAAAHPLLPGIGPTAPAAAPKWQPGTSLSTRAAWVILLALISGFALSQAFRSVTAIMAVGLQAEFALSAQALGTFAGAFAFAFGGMQLFMGIGIDLYGVRRTLLVAFPFTVLGAVVSALAPHYGGVLFGQVLLGIGCAPAFLVCTVFIARHFPAHQFAMVSGLAIGIGGLGMLFTGTPLAWLVQHYSWRTGFGVLAVFSVWAWALMVWKVREPSTPAVTSVPTPAEDALAPPGRAPASAGPAPARESVANAVRSYGALFLLPHTAGILLLGLVTYAALLTLRGLWLGPLLIERHGYSLVASGHVAMLFSLVSLFTPALFGRTDPGPLRRRRWLVGFTLLLAGIFAAMGAWQAEWLDVGGSLAVGVLCGYMVLQYSDVRAAYPAAMTGRAMAVFTMAMFLGVAMMQWLTGVAASWAQTQGADPYTAVMLTIAALLTTGALGFQWLPAPTAATPSAGR